MKDYRKFSYAFLLVMFLFVAFHFCVWQKTKKILELPLGYQVGDVARLAYDTSIAEVKKLEDIDLKKKHILLSKNVPRKVDVLTLGDSFSKGGGGGKNPYYQDYIATYNGMNVLYAHDYKAHHFNCVQTLLILLNSGYLDKVKPKYVILESAEKYCIKRLAFGVDLALTDDYKTVKANYDYFDPKPVNGQNFKKVLFINNGNFKHLLYKFLYNFSPSAFISKVYKFKTDKKLYGKDYALIYKDEIKNAQQVLPGYVQKVNDNLNEIGKLLEQKGIQLYFMPVVDKYNLYYDFYLNNPYPKSEFFSLLRKQNQTNYKLIDTDKILSEELKNDIDLFFYDDTHWTHKASEAIFKKVKF